MPTQVQAASRKERVRTAHTLHLGFEVCAGADKVCGAATHAVGVDAGYSLLYTGYAC